MITIIGAVLVLGILITVHEEVILLLPGLMVLLLKNFLWDLVLKSFLLINGMSISESHLYHWVAILK